MKIKQMTAAEERIIIVRYGLPRQKHAAKTGKNAGHRPSEDRKTDAEE